MKLRERTKGREEEHVDERAWKFFSYGYSGEYSYHWKSTSEGLRPTAVLQCGYTYPVCAYCGRQALPIQGEHRGPDGSWGSTSYYDRGHCCVCKDAMDELEYKDKENEIRDKMNQLISDLRKVSPAVNPEVVKALVEERAEQDLKELEKHTKRSCGFHPSKLDALGIKLKFDKREDN